MSRMMMAAWANLNEMLGNIEQLVYDAANETCAENLGEIRALENRLRTAADHLSIACRKVEYPHAFKGPV